MINTKFFCRLCALLHDPRSSNPGHHYEDFNDWWRGKGTCINGSWKKFDVALQKDKDAAALRRSLNMPKNNSLSVEQDNADTKIQSDQKTTEANVLDLKQIHKANGDDKSLDFEDPKP